jgi:hypothetical protein
MANTLEVSTMKGSVVMAKIAGIESTAKITSVIADQHQHDEQRRVLAHLPSCHHEEAVVHVAPQKGRCARIQRSIGFFSRLGVLPGPQHLDPGEQQEGAEHVQHASGTALISRRAAKIMTARSTMAPSTP